MKKYDPITKELTKINNYYDLERCSADNFQSEFEKSYHKGKENNFQYCVKDPDNNITLKGDESSSKYKNDNSYVVYEVHKCTDNLRK
jgi:hypothetical protein